MLQFFKNVLQYDTDNRDKFASNKDRIKIATCALFLEIANSDDKIADVEMEKIYSIMREQFDLHDDEISNLIELSKQQIQKSISIYEFTEIINNNFSDDEKFEVIKNLWRIILADQVLDPYEEHLIKTISGNMNFYHKELIAAKLEVKKEMGSN